MSDVVRIVLIGVGGVGSWLLRTLTPFVHSRFERVSLVVVDGDGFEEANRSRMLFSRPGPKPAVLVEELAAIYGDRINFLPVPHYITPRRWRIIDEGDVVFCAPDNHKTRRTVERRCQQLRDVVLISGGNDGVGEGQSGTFGNVQIFVREAGRNRTNPISAFHPEIRNPADLLPTELGCAAAAPSAPQLIVTNVAVAAGMLSAYYAWLEGRLAYEESYLDVAAGVKVAIERELL